MTLLDDDRVLMDRYIPKEVRELLRENYIVYSVVVDIRKQMVHYTLSHGVSTNEYVESSFLVSTDYTSEEIFTENIIFLVKDFIYQVNRHHEEHRNQEWLPNSFHITKSK